MSINPTDHLGLVRSMAARYARLRPGQRVEDTDEYQDGCMGLMFAALRFDPTLPYQFSTYASSCIFGYIHRGKRDRRPAGARSPTGKTWGRHDVSFSDLDSATNDEDQNRPESLAVSHDPEPWCEQEELVNRIFKALHQRERVFVYLHIVERWTLEEIGNQAGVTRERVRQVVEKALTKARKYLAGRPK